MEKTLTIGKRADESSARETFDVDYDDVYREQFRNFVAATRGEDARIVSGEEGRRSLEIVSAATESLRTRQPADIRPGR